MILDWPRNTGWWNFPFIYTINWNIRKSKQKFHFHFKSCAFIFVHNLNNTVDCGTCTKLNAHSFSTVAQNLWLRTECLCAETWYKPKMIFWKKHSFRTKNSEKRQALQRVANVWRYKIDRHARQFLVCTQGNFFLFLFFACMRKLCFFLFVCFLFLEELCF